MDPRILAGLSVLVLLVGALATWVHLRRQRARDRIQDAAIELDLDDPEVSSLRRWLFRSGYRNPSAPSRFWSYVALSALVGAVAAILLQRSQPILDGREALENLGGSVAVVALFVLDVSGLVLVLIFASLPWIYVRRKRRERVKQVESDLPVALEILASLARSGTSFDAAVAQILTAARADEPRALAEELSIYRADVLAGLPRETAFNRLAERADVPSVDVFVQALTHSERLGAGLSGTLRQQADELWSVRRERTLAKAQTLPARLSAPLILCFLPGLLIVTLGPAAVQFWETLTGVTESIR